MLTNEIDLFTEGYGERLFQGDSVDQSGDGVQRTVAWLNEFDETCRQECRDWLKNSNNAFKYFRGTQSRKKKNRGIMFFVFNLIRHRMLSKNGILTQNKPTASIQGVDLEDETIAQALADLVDFSSDRSDFDTKLADACLDMLICGLGVLSEHWDFDGKRFNSKYGWIDGNFSLTREDPRKYAFPKHDDETFSGEGNDGAEGYTKEYTVRRAKLQARFSDFSAEIDELEAHTKGASKTSKTSSGEKGPNDELRVVETYYYKDIPEEFVVKTFEDGPEQLARLTPDQVQILLAAGIEAEAEQPMDADMAKVVEEAEAAGGELDYRYRVRTKLRPQVWHAAVASKKLLLWNQPSIYKHNMWPDIFLVGQKDHDESMPYGEVEQLMAGQDLIDSILAMMVDNLSRTNAQGRVVDKSLVSREMQSDLRERMSKPGYYIESVAGKADEVVWKDEQQPLDMAAMGIVNWVLAVFDEMSNIAQVQRGGMPYNTSGRGIEKLLGAGDTALEHLKKNMVFAIRRFGRMRLSNLQQFLTVTDKIRISKDYEDHYKLNLEWFTPEDNPDAGSKLRLVRYQDGLKPEDGGVKVVTPDFEAMEFDITYQVVSNTQRDPVEKRERITLAIQNGLATPAWAAKELEIPRTEFMRAQEMNEKLKMATFVEELSKDEQFGEIVKGIVNPETSDQMLSTIGQALSTMTAQKTGSPTPQLTAP